MKIQKLKNIRLIVVYFIALTNLMLFQNCSNYSGRISSSNLEKSSQGEIPTDLTGTYTADNTIVTIDDPIDAPCVDMPNCISPSDPNGPDMSPNGPSDPNGPDMSPNGPSDPNGPDMSPNGPSDPNGPGMSPNGPSDPNGPDMSPNGPDMSPEDPEKDHGKKETNTDNNDPENDSKHDNKGSKHRCDAAMLVGNGKVLDLNYDDHNNTDINNNNYKLIRYEGSEPLHLNNVTVHGFTKICGNIIIDNLKSNGNLQTYNVKANNASIAGGLTTHRIDSGFYIEVSKENSNFSCKIDDDFKITDVSKKGGQ